MNRIALILLAAALATQAADTTTTARDDHRARIDAAIAARDYQAWKAERDAWGAKGRMADKVTAENFETFAKLHEAMKAGRTEEAAQLREQLGISRAGRGDGQARKGGNGTGDGQGMGGGKGKGRHGNGQGTGGGCAR